MGSEMCIRDRVEGGSAPPDGISWTNAGANAGLDHAWYTCKRKYLDCQMLQERKIAQRECHGSERKTSGTGIIGYYLVSGSSPVRKRPQFCHTSVFTTGRGRAQSFYSLRRRQTPPRFMSMQDSPQSSDSYMSVRSMVYWALRLQSVLGSVCVMSRVGFHSVSLVLLISCLHALAGVRQPIIHEL